VDLSAKMLAHAQRCEVYDRLVCEELTTYLHGAAASADVIIAADVLIYFGELGPLAEAMAKSLRSGGLLAISTERAATAGYACLPSGRFAHNPAYVRSVFAAEFTECHCAETTVRLEATEAVAGNLFIFRRRVTA
jgi:predicted TPR repeat methyltransferase